MSDYIANENWTWLPPVLFFAILAIAFAVGYANGFRVAMYYLIINVIFLLVAVLSGSAIIGSFDSLIKDNLLDSLGFSATVINDLLSSLSKWMVPVLTFFTLIIVNVLAFLISWIFRRMLKKKIKQNKAIGTSNMKRRFAGSSIAILTATPIAVFGANIATVTATQNGFTKFNAKLTNIFTFGKAEALYESLPLMKLISEQSDGLNEAFESIKGIFDPAVDAAASADKINEISGSISDALNSNITYGLVGGVLEDILGDDAAIDTSVAAPAKPAEANPFDLNRTGQVNMVKLASTTVGGQYSDAKANYIFGLLTNWSKAPVLTLDDVKNIIK